MSIAADALAALRKDFAWSSAHDVCAELHIDPATHLDYPSRKFVFELLSDVNTSSAATFGVDFQLHRWLINGRRFEVIMEMGAWDGTTTCGLFQRKSFRIDPQVTFGVDREWKHTLIAVDDWQPSLPWGSPLEGLRGFSATGRPSRPPPHPPPSPPPRAPQLSTRHRQLGKTRMYWQFLCNLQSAANGTHWLTQRPQETDCPRQPEAHVIPMMLRPNEDQHLESSHAMAAIRGTGIQPELIYFNPPRHGFDSLRSLPYLWDDVLACDGTFAGHGIEDEVVRIAVFDFAQRRRLKVDIWWVHAPHSKWERLMPWDGIRPPAFKTPFSVWAIRHKHDGPNCTLPPPPAPPMAPPPSPESPPPIGDLDNLNDKCWEQCHEIQGRCPHRCGMSGACCRKGYPKAPASCGSGSLGCLYNHCCVAAFGTQSQSPPPPPLPSTPAHHHHQHTEAKAAPITFFSPRFNSRMFPHG